MILPENPFPLFGIMLPILSMILSENRLPLFGIMLYSSGGKVRSQATMASMSASFIFLK
jgi:hypothetical protein